MNIFITGVAGFIASNLSEELIEDNTIIGIDNFDTFYNRSVKENNLKTLIKKTNFTYYEKDLLDFNALDAIFNKYEFDLCMHFAARAGVRPSMQHPISYTRTNVEGTINIIEVCRKHRVTNFIFASSSSVYGNNHKLPFSENDNTDNPISPYAATKKSGELLLHAYAKLYGMKTTALRFFTVYGRRQRPDLAICKFIRLIDEGKAIPFFGDSNTGRDYTYIDDIIDGITKCKDWLIRQPEGTFEIFNLGRSDVVKLEELVGHIETLLDKKAVLNKLPLQSGDVIRTYADISKAHKYFGYDPKTFIQDGLKKQIEYFKDFVKK